jgi:hypothetical protein
MVMGLVGNSWLKIGPGRSASHANKTSPPKAKEDGDLLMLFNVGTSLIELDALNAFVGFILLNPVLAKGWGAGDLPFKPYP